MTAHSKKIKTDENGYLRIVYGEVYAPDRPDSGGDFMTAETIREMAWRFMRDQNTKKVDVEHQNGLTPGVEIVESFIARDGDTDFIPGAWVVGAHIPDDEIWGQILDGTLNGFSMEALVMQENVIVEVDFPPVVTGQTSTDDDHSHTFYVTYDQAGIFQGGTTSSVDGHTHDILAGTHTEEADGHTHRFSAVDDVKITK